MRRLTCLAVAAAAAFAGPELTHTGVLKTATFDARYRPGSRAGAAAERDGAAAERDFKDICGKLAFQPDVRFTLWLYDDVPELQAITGNRMAGAYSAGRDSHLPFGDDQTRYHEMVHLVAACLPKSGDEARGMFLAEGLANALLEYVHGVHVHAVARFYRTRKELPPLATFLDADFYAWLRAHPGFNAYDVAGSFVRHLIDAHGIEAVKRYYTGMSAKEAFGADERALESAWQKAIDAFVLRPEVETLLRQRAGEAAKFDVYALDPDARIPPAILGKPGDWKALAGEKLHPRDEIAWKGEGEATVASGAGDQWHVCVLGSRKYKDCAVRARIVTEDIRGGIQLQLGGGCCALLVGNGTFVYRNGAGTAMSTARTVTPTGEVDLMLVRRGGRMEVWVDGFRLAEGPVDGEAAPVGIGFHTGAVRFENVRVREFK
ncbi:MAG TPA: hypothetical protein VFY93_17040 [Planctomycetota bacterium]|nr:hypothetical protein [Planctomycetota bacterium]